MRDDSRKDGKKEGERPLAEKKKRADGAQKGRGGNDRARRVILHAVSSALFAALIAAGAMLSLPAGSLKFSFQLLFVLLAAGLLPIYDGAAAVFTYLFLGLIGLPVFAGFSSGPAAIAGPTGGFIVGFLPAALLSGALILLMGRAKMPDFVKYGIAFTAGTAACYLFGWIFFCIYLPQKGAFYALQAAVLPYLPFDLVKIAAAALITCRVKPYSDRLLLRRRREEETQKTPGENGSL